MEKNGRVTTYSMYDIKAMRARCEGKTDLSGSLSEAEIEAQIAADPDLFVPENWQGSVIADLPHSIRTTQGVNNPILSPLL